MGIPSSSACPTCPSFSVAGVDDEEVGDDDNNDIDLWSAGVFKMHSLLPSYSAEKKK